MSNNFNFPQRLYKIFSQKERGFQDQYDDLIVSAVGLNPAGLTAAPP